jgi:hypothetical protein
VYPACFGELALGSEDQAAGLDGAFDRQARREPGFVLLLQKCQLEPGIVDGQMLLGEPAAAQQAPQGGAAEHIDPIPPGGVGAA